MFSGYNILNLYCVVAILYFNHPISARLCYNCVSTFPSNQVCLPSCSQSYQANSTCLLTRNITLVPVSVGSVRAGHIAEETVISDAVEKTFVYGEEAVYKNPSQAVGWDWEYGAITYGCDTDGCNNPQNVNLLPNALNARIPNETLDRLLIGDLDSSCYVCSLCLNESITGADINDCALTPCPNHACSFVATRSSTTGSSQCNGGWHFSSSCIPSTEPAQIDMTLMYYIGSKTTVLYQMEAICLSDNCNNFTTFKQLKDAITVNPDLSCLINGTSSSTTYASTLLTTTRTNPTVSTTSSTGTPSRSSTTTTTSSGGPTFTTTSSGITTTGGGVTTTGGGVTTTGGGVTTTGGGVTTTGRGVTTTSSSGPITTTTTGSSAETLFLNTKFSILILFFSFYNYILK